MQELIDPDVAHARPDRAETPPRPLRVGLVGIGKMGVSHLAIAGAHDLLDVVGVCDSQAFVLSGLRSQIAVPTYKNFDALLDEAQPDCLFIATPTRSHFDLASQALGRGVNLFVEKPLTLSASQSRQLADDAIASGLANQVGYHNRFIATFEEAARLVSSGAIGEVHHVDGRAFGPVVTSPGGGGFTWRSHKAEGGGCLHDYACHVIDLMNFVVGPPQAVVGAVLSSIHSRDVEDAVHALFTYSNGSTGSLETNWSDRSQRKMTTTISVHGSRGRIYADRQELRLHLDGDQPFEDYQLGWTIRYITELQQPVWYYLRGEEYSAQVDEFVRDSLAGNPNGRSSFATAAETDRVVQEIIESDERRGTLPPSADLGPVAGEPQWGNWLRQMPIPARLKRVASGAARQVSHMIPRRSVR